MKMKDLNRFQRWLISIGRMKVITTEENNPNIDKDETDIYMCRYFLWRSRIHNKKSNLFLHKICRSDTDRHLHDHPWNWATFLLWGSYREVTRNEYLGSTLGIKWKDSEKSQTFSALSFRTGKATKFHRLVLKKPVWTLFWHGPVVQQWGFNVNSVKINSEEYLTKENK